MFFSCTERHSSSEQKENSISVNSIKNNATKPPSSFQDTLVINKLSAVFYHPDSIQKEKIKQVTDSAVYAASMHEYFYQMRNARIVIQQTWPHLTIIESKNYRYLLFQNKDGSTDLIDLNTKNDTHGLFVFDGKKAPVLIDMTNLETDISFYLTNK